MPPCSFLSVRDVPTGCLLVQQTVEKATKAVGLLLGLIKPTSVDLKKVSHATILGILLRYPERIEELRSQIITTSKSPGMKSAKRELTELGLGGLLPATQEMLRKLPSKETASRQVPLIQSLPSNLMWDVTLNLDPLDPRVAAVFKMLDDVEAQWKAIDDFQLWHEKLAPYLGDPDLIRYFLNINGKAFPEIAPLAFVSMWHERDPLSPNRIQRLLESAGVHPRQGVGENAPET